MATLPSTKSDASYRVACSTCGSKPGEPCQKMGSVVTAKHPHATRAAAALAAHEARVNAVAKEEHRARLKVRAEYQRDAATACDAAAERLLTEIGNAEKYRDAFEDESEARMWVGRAADALRQAREFLTARARANIDAAKYRPGEDG